jgi:hypothetical protein
MRGSTFLVVCLAQSIVLNTFSHFHSLCSVYRILHRHIDWHSHSRVAVLVVSTASKHQARYSWNQCLVPMPLRNALQELVLHGFPGCSVSILVIVNLACTFDGQGSVVAVYLSRSSSYLFGGVISNQYQT